MNNGPDLKPDGVAVIGMSCRFPGAKTPAEFWENLQNGRESISFFSDSELRDAGVAENLLASPHYVKAAPTLDDVDKFDAEFFRCSPKEAALMDPQQRLFLECAWEALENAGYDPLRAPNRVGVYAGALINTYLLSNIASGATPLSLDFSDFLETLVASDKDFLATRTAYKLNLKGPAITVQTACSTGLVAVHLARQSLLNGECESALAGAVSVRFPHRVGYLYRPGGLVSPDGHCRPFSDRAGGTLFGSGVGVVVLKRLEDAIADRDFIHAVIRGTAVNNDGASKMSYAAPAIAGHAEVVAEALAVAGVDAATVGYIETHGTATDLGDPVEVSALTQAFQATTSRKQFCALGSVKSNFGHLDTAAGIAGLIKAVLVLEHGLIPATLHFERPNPKLDLEEGPFFVNSSNVRWNSASGPRRAGVSSLGVGGTNAHAVLEEAPLAPTAADWADQMHLLVLSARSTSSLREQVSRYRAHFLGNPKISLADACHTAARGRHHFAARIAIVAGSLTEAAEQLARASLPALTVEGAPRLAMLFSGQGSHYPGMARGLYAAYPVFRESLDAAQELVRPLLDRPLLDRPLLDVIFSDAGLPDQTLYAQPALLAVDLAVFDLWRSWGIVPAMVMGHSLGEYAAATVAGVFRREDAFRLVCERARLMQSLPGSGAMAAVRGPAGLSVAIIREMPGLDLAALNSPEEIVISGPQDIVDVACRSLESQGATCRTLAVSHAFHSRLTEPILDRLAKVLSTMELSAPRLPIVSNLTGELGGKEMTEPAYWCNHARHTVKFADGIQTLHREGCGLFIEAGPGSILLGAGSSGLPPETDWLASTRPGVPDERTILESLGRLYSRGVEVDWDRYYESRPSRRIPLPTYPFEGKRHWVQGRAQAAQPAAETLQPSWLYSLQWRVKRLEPAASRQKATSRVVLVGDGAGFASRLHGVLGLLDIPTTVLPSLSARQYSEVTASDIAGTTTVVYLSALGITSADFEATERVTCEVAELAAAMTQGRGEARLWIVTRGSLPPCGAVLKSGVFQAALGGLARGLEVECSEIWGGIVDLDAEGDDDEARAFSREILSGGDGENQIAYRGGDRLVCRLVPATALRGGKNLIVDPEGTYLITGGTGGVGPAVAQWLVDQGARHLILTSRSGVLPASLEALRRDGGAKLQIEAIDAADPDAMQRLMASIAATGHPLRGVVHLAGTIDYRQVSDLSAASVGEALGPKARGAWILHELTKALRLDFFVMFSSMSAILPGPDMSAYAASNAFLDSLAHYRRSAGLPGLAVNWGPWSGKGMGAARVSARERSGVKLIESGPALDCLGHLIGTGAAQAVAVDVDWSVFRPLYESRRGCSLLEDLGGTSRVVPPVASGSAVPAEIVRLRSAPRLQQRGLLEQYVRTQVLAVLGIDPVPGIETGKRLFEAGLDSLRAIELRNQLQADLECALPATLTLNYSTIEAITGFLAGTLPFLQKPGPNQKSLSVPNAGL